MDAVSAVSTCAMALPLLVRSVAELFSSGNQQWGLITCSWDCDGGGGSLITSTISQLYFRHKEKDQSEAGVTFWCFMKAVNWCGNVLALIKREKGKKKTPQKTNQCFSWTFLTSGTTSITPYSHSSISARKRWLEIYFTPVLIQFEYSFKKPIITL